MAVFNPLTNLFTNYGFAATETIAVDDNVTDASAATDANAAVGAAPAAGTTFDIQMAEPGPDAFSELGDDLKLEKFSDPLFVGSPAPGQPVQGFLDNCPLIAVLTAMTHVPKMRDVIEAGGIVRERVGRFSTFRIREMYEYRINERPNIMPRLPEGNRNFEGNRFFAANFFQNPQLAAIGPRQSVNIWFAGHNVTRLVSPVFYKFDGNSRFQEASPPLHLYYAHSTNRALYPSAIEKAYVYLKCGSGQVNYQKINDGLPVDEVMYEVAGYARHGVISQPPHGSFDLLPNKRWKRWLEHHHTRPTILTSKRQPEPSSAQNTSATDYVQDPDLVVGDHAYPVIGFDGMAKTITVVNVLKEVGEANREVTIPIARVKHNFIDIVQGGKEYGQGPLEHDPKKQDID